MTRAEEYDYNKFLSDSSDDHPKYDEGIEEKDAECRDTEDLKVALHNVLEVSNEWLAEQDMLSISEDDRKGIERSIRITENFLSNLADSNIALAKADS